MSKRPHRLALPVAMLLMLVAAVFASAHGWTPFEFESGGHYEYRVEQFQHSFWDDTATTSEHFYTISVRPTGVVSRDGERLLEVTTATRRNQAESELKDLLSFGMFAFNEFFMFGNPFQLALLLDAVKEMDLEVGERMTIFGVGRISIVEQEAVAGRTGLVVRFEQGDAGDRRVYLEWVIDEKLSLPLGVRQYDDDGSLTLRTTLVKYDDN